MVLMAGPNMILIIVILVLNINSLISISGHGMEAVGKEAIQ